LRSMRKRIAQARGLGCINAKGIWHLARRLADLSKSKEFLFEWNRIKVKSADIFYSPGSTRIYFDLEFCDYFQFREFELGSRIAEKYSYVKKGALDEIKAFLDKYRIDAVNNGNPLVDIFYFRSDRVLDKSHRKIFQIELPLVLHVREARKIFESEYSGFRKEFIIESSDDNWPFDYDIPKKRWGENTGKNMYYRERDHKIVKEYVKLKCTGLTDDEIYFRIFDKLKLENDMSEYDSIKPIIDAYKKSKLKK